jgi:hypothetical protein
MFGLVTAMLVDVPLTAAAAGVSNGATAAFVCEVKEESDASL